MKQIPLFEVVPRDAIPIKVDIASLEHALFSVTKQPRRKVRIYAVGKDHEIRIIPSALGGPTIHDKDILVYCASQLLAALNSDVKVEKTLLINPYHLLTSIGRSTGGSDYQRLLGALTRLRGTTIETKLKTGGIRQERGFGLIDSWEFIATQETHWSRLKITLSDWYFRAIMAKEVLTVDPAYFSLEGREKRLYELLRKHVGRQRGHFRIGLELLREKCGSISEPRRFKYELRKIIRKIQSAQKERLWHPICQYDLELDGDILVAVLNESVGPLKLSRKKKDLVEFNSNSQRSHAIPSTEIEVKGLQENLHVGISIGAVHSIRRLTRS